MNIEIYSKVKEIIESADAIVIGAGAGLSTAAGINYGESSFKENFPELVSHYNFKDMYTSSFYNFTTEEEKWSYWAKHINYLCVDVPALDLYKKLYKILQNKNYFVITTNVDRQFVKAGFDEDKVFEIQGTLTKIQCANACHNKLYDDVDMVKEMLKQNNDIKIPSHLVPKCPNCGENMEVNLRKDNFFVEDEHWYTQSDKYEEFIEENKNKKILFLELGVGFNTPSVIRFPFEELTYNLDNAYLIRINNRYANIPNDIEDKAIGIMEDINKVIDSL